MPLVLISFIAGALTVLAPCILPLLPVILGGSLVTGDTKQQKPGISRALAIIISLCTSILVFSLLLKASTALLGIPQVVWQLISGGIIIAFGLTLLFPVVWASLIAKTGIESASNKLLGKGLHQRGLGGDIVIGAALGPIFNSCSPTYALIVASILPASFFTGLVYLLAYTLGLGLMLLAIAIFGQKLIGRLSGLSDPKGIAHKVIAVLFILVGVAILFGIDKKTQTFLLDHGVYDPISRIEQRIKH